jgi:hypothetical protein
MFGQREFSYTLVGELLGDKGLLIRKYYVVRTTVQQCIDLRNLRCCDIGKWICRSGVRHATDRKAQVGQQ